MILQCVVGKFLSDALEVIFNLQENYLGCGSIYKAPKENISWWGADTAKM